MVAASKDLIGASGRRYLFEELLQERPHVGRVWLATSGQDKFVLKDTPKGLFLHFNEGIRPKLPQSPYIRLPVDDIPDQRIFVYKYLTDDFLRLVRKGISTEAKKCILKSSLRGIADLHACGIVHLDIKPDNIMVDCREAGQETVIEKVHVTDLENAAHLPKPRCIKGMLPGNDNWRSPEGHFRGELNKPHDLFSFGAVCLYAVLGRVIFGPDEDFRKHEGAGIEPFLIRLQRQVCYFGNKDSMNGLMKHVGDEEINCQILRMLYDERHDENIPYRPFSEWEDVGDANFRDLIQRLMDLDPAKRITARQALDHPWFAGIPLADAGAAVSI